MTAKTAAATFDVAAVRAEFPALQQLVHGKPLVYLDNAATTQKPRWSSPRVIPNPRPLDAPVTIATCCWTAFVLIAFVS